MTEKWSHQFDIAEDGHLTTVITGVGDVSTGQVTIACAGHPRPLLLDGRVHPVGTSPSPAPAETAAQALPGVGVR